MKLKPIIGLVAAGLIVIGTYTGAVAAGYNPVQLITTARCESGAFLTRSSDVSSVAADSDTSDAVSINNLGKSTKASDTQLIGSNLISNPGFETPSKQQPLNWLTNVYGNNNAAFSTVPGHNSPVATQVAITNYTTGDADWYYNALPVTPGQYYQFSDYYRSNITTRAVLGLTDTTGTMQYINLPSTPASNSWIQYSVNFFIPQNITKAIVFHPLASKGWLQTDDNALTAAHAEGFSRPLVSVTFDDGWESIHKNALPILKQYQLPSTQYIISGYVGNASAYMNAKDIYDLSQSGSEIASHTVDHVDLTKQSASSLNYELTRSQHDLSACFGSITDFAEPLGTYNATTESAMAQIYATARSTDVGFNTADNTNPYALKVQNVSATTTNDQLAAWIETAKKNHTWLILVYHQVDTTSGTYTRTPKDFATDMQTLKASGVTVSTVHAAYTEVKPQLQK